MSSAAAILSQGVGYAVVLGIGIFFSIVMVGLTKVQSRYTKFDPKTASEFASASHSVKPGLIASGIVSAWTWSATLLQSSAVAYKFGISGPWAYAAGATVQVLLFAQNAIKLKMNAPKAHTFLEVINVRWGKTAHLVFLFFSLSTNMIVSGMLLTGGSATVSDLTGMSTPAACMLIPLPVILYVSVGGMRSTLIADYLHTTFLYAIILTFMFVVYTTSPLIGSPGQMWEKLTEKALMHPIAGNHDGSYLTMRSKSGIIFGVINLVGNFATVYNDQAYWQRAIASNPKTCTKAYILGGLCWLAVPLSMATAMGLSAAALNLDLTPAQVSAGLPAPAAAAALLGKGGAALILVLLFLAVTSALSAELVAVSSVLTFDVYKTYINPSASEARILFVDQMCIVIAGLVFAVWGIVLFYAKLSMGWLYEFMGTLLGGAVFPIAAAIMWRKANRKGCIAGSIIGLACGVTAWLVATKTLEGEINMTTTLADYPMLAGNLVSLGLSAIISIVTSLVWPEDYDWQATRALHTADGLDNHFEHQSHAHAKETTIEPSGHEITEEKDDKRAVASHVASAAQSIKGDKLEEEASSSEGGGSDDEADQQIDLVEMQKGYRLAVWVSVILFVVLILAVPMPLFGSARVFNKKDFTAWVAVSFTWLFLGSFGVVLYPVFESRFAIVKILKAMIKDVFGAHRMRSSTEAA